MCIAIYQEVGYRLTDEEFDNSWRANPDGGGIAYFDERGQVQCRKSMNRSEFYDIYNEVVEKHGQHSMMAVHFRIATHGGVNISNCHPFMVPGKNIALIHNGVIPVVMEKGEPRSDTRVFVEDVLTRMPENWLDDEQLFQMVEEYIGWSKLVILTGEHKYRAYILNENEGKWSTDRKMWFSNNSHCAVPKNKSSNKWSNPALWTPESFEDEDYLDVGDALGECKVCGISAVFDDACYECETCQNCRTHLDKCRCYSQLGSHGMTDDEWRKYAWNQ